MTIVCQTIYRISKLDEKGIKGGRNENEKNITSGNKFLYYQERGSNKAKG